MYAEAMKNAISDLNYEVKNFETGQDLLNSLSENPDIVVLDYMLPDYSGMDLLKIILKDHPTISLIILSGQEDVNTVVEMYRNGAKNYIVKNENAMNELRNSVKNLADSIELKKEVDLMKDELTDRSKYSKIIGKSTAIFKVLKLIQRVEKTDSLVLITGESGTGKELIAEAIHNNSHRSRKPFIAVNLAAIPVNLIEDELFGHEKGAFTGASSRRIGKFEEAQDGTIFLDEIGEMDILMQTKLLRVLQESRITRLGSNKEIKLNVRIVVATNRNLSEMVKAGKFREDLYYRIQGFLIHLPRLKDRGNDYLILANHFLNHFVQKHRLKEKTFDDSALEALAKHEWQGNVRELIAFMDRTVLMSDSDIIRGSDLIFSENI